MGKKISLCICCHKNEVTWPQVCNDCIDHEAQSELEGHLIAEGVRSLNQIDPYNENIMDWMGGECKTCGMLYDGGMRCTYCGDPDPWE